MLALNPVLGQEALSMAKNPSLFGMQRLSALSVGLMGLMHACRVNSAKRLRHLFEQIDTDHDGKFDASDFRFFLHKSSMRLEKMTQVSRTPPCFELREHQCAPLLNAFVRMATANL